MIIDTSAILAILFEEPEEDLFLEKIATAPHLGMSAANYVEAGLRLDGIDRGKAEALDQLIKNFSISIESVTIAQAFLARETHRRFGRGNHPARLNYGDCFAYALAKATGYPLLYKGNDFAQTDIAAA